jgi:hypothetical protein
MKSVSGQLDQRKYHRFIIDKNYAIKNYINIDFLELLIFLYLMICQLQYEAEDTAENSVKNNDQLFFELI